jgi:hypothetical protein
MLNPFSRRGDSYKLVVRMVGIKMGDRLLHLFCPDGGRLGAIAAGVGLSGRAVCVVTDAAAAARATRGAAQAGVLVEVEQSPPSQLPVGNDAFDVAIVDDTGGAFASLRAEDRVRTVRELARALRSGGRVMVMSTAARGGLGALVSRAQSGPPFDPAPSLQADGFRQPRVLGEREGLVFVEALKAN